MRSIRPSGMCARVNQQARGPVHVRLDAALALEGAIEHHVQHGGGIQRGDIEPAQSVRAATVHEHLRAADGNIRRIARALFHGRVVIRVRSGDGDASAAAPHLDVVERLAHDDVFDPAVLAIALERHGDVLSRGQRAFVRGRNDLQRFDAALAQAFDRGRLHHHGRFLVEELSVDRIGERHIQREAIAFDGADAPMNRDRRIVLHPRLRTVRLPFRFRTRLSMPMN